MHMIQKKIVLIDLDRDLKLEWCDHIFGTWSEARSEAVSFSPKLFGFIHFYSGSSALAFLLSLFLSGLSASAMWEMRLLVLNSEIRCCHSLFLLLRIGLMLILLDVGIDGLDIRRHLGCEASRRKEKLPMMGNYVATSFREWSQCDWGWTDAWREFTISDIISLANWCWLFAITVCRDCLTLPCFSVSPSQTEFNNQGLDKMSESYVIKR